MRPNNQKSRRATNVLLWTFQGALSALFLFAGGVKLILPIADLTHQMPVPGLFLRFIGIVEVLCAVGLVLPGILRKGTSSTLLACAGIVVVMIGAVGVTLASGGGVAAFGPVVIGTVAAIIAYGRWRVLPRETLVRQLALRLAA